MPTTGKAKRSMICAGIDAGSVDAGSRIRNGSAHENAGSSRSKNDANLRRCVVHVVTVQDPARCRLERERFDALLIARR
jgi:hypothetical protein